MRICLIDGSVFLTVLNCQSRVPRIELLKFETFAILIGVVKAIVVIARITKTLHKLPMCA